MNGSGLTPYIEQQQQQQQQRELLNKFFLLNERKNELTFFFEIKSESFGFLAIFFFVAFENCYYAG